MTTTDQTPHRDGARSLPTREEQFDATGPVAATIHLVSGDMNIRTHAGAAVTVRLSASGSRAAQLVADTQVSFDRASGRLEVRSPLRTGSGGFGRKFFTSPFDGDVNLDLTIPEGSSLDLHSASGDATAAGSYAAVTFASASGDLALEGADVVEAQTASGDIMLGRVHASTSAKSASGDVQVSSLVGDAHVESVSGDVSATVDGPCTLDVHSVSGDVVVDIREGLVVTVTAKTLSGDLRSDIDLHGVDTSETSDDGRVELRARTVSGDVRVRRASSGGPSGLRPLLAKLLLQGARGGGATTSVID